MVNSAPSEIIAFHRPRSRWQHADGSELANAQSFTRELCETARGAGADPARADTAENAYVYERARDLPPRRRFQFGGAHRLLPARRLRAGGEEAQAGALSKGFDDGMLRARAQAENYARTLPARRAGRRSCSWSTSAT